MKRLTGLVALLLFSLSSAPAQKARAPASAQSSPSAQRTHAGPRVAAAGAPHSVILTFYPGSGPAPLSYNVYRGTIAGGEATTPLLTGAATGCTVGPCTITDTALLVAGTTYFYQVTAVNSAGESPRSNEASGTIPMVVIPPLPPTNLNARYIGPWISLPFTPGTDAVPGTSYNVYRGTAPGAEAYTPLLTGRAAGCGLSCTSIADTTATVPGATYYYQITAVSGGIEGPKSNEAFVLVPLIFAAIPLAPANLTCVAQ